MIHLGGSQPAPSLFSFLKVKRLAGDHLRTAHISPRKSLKQTWGHTFVAPRGQVELSWDPLSCRNPRLGPAEGKVRHWDQLRNGPHSGGSFCRLWWKIVRPSGGEGFLFEGVAHFLRKGGQKTPPMPRRLHGSSQVPLIRLGSICRIGLLGASLLV